MEDLGESGVLEQERSAASGREVRMWHDDIRPAPAGWTWVRTNAEAMALLSGGRVTEASLDHDMGLHHYTEEQIAANEELLFGKGLSEEGTGYDLVNWMCERDLVPARVTIHSWNPVGAQAMAARLNHFGHNCVIDPFRMPR